MKTVLVLLVLLCPLTAQAESPPETFASDVVTLLDRELPRMQSAVAQKDRAYFGAAFERVQNLLRLWEQRQGPGVLDQYPACTHALTDFLIVGLCRISPPGSICEPDTFIPKVDRYIEQCRVLAASKAER